MFSGYVIPTEIGLGLYLWGFVVGMLVMGIATRGKRK